jgi:fatty acid synthase
MMDLVGFFNSLDIASPKTLWLHASIIDKNNCAMIGIARTLRHEYPTWTIHVVEFLVAWDESSQRNFIKRNLVTLAYPEQEYRVSAEGGISVSRLVAVGDLELSDPRDDNSALSNSEWENIQPLPNQLLGGRDIVVDVQSMSPFSIKTTTAECVGFAGIVRRGGLEAKIPFGTSVFSLTEHQPVSDTTIVRNCDDVTIIPEGCTLSEAATLIGPLCKCAYVLNMMPRMLEKLAMKRAVVHVWKSEVLWALTLAQILTRRGWQIFVAIHDSLPVTADTIAPGFLCNVLDFRHFVREVSAWTSGLGVDYIFSTQGFDLDSGLWYANLEILNKFGCLTIAGECDMTSLEGSRQVVKLTSVFSTEDLLTFQNDARELIDLLLSASPNPFVSSLPTLLNCWLETETSRLTVDDNKEDHFSVTTSPKAFNPCAAYVLIGGVGGLGISLAECIIRSGGRKIILTSRSGIRGFQGKYVQTKSTSVHIQGRHLIILLTSLGHLIREHWRLENLRKLPGVEIDVVAADATDEDAMRSVFQSINRPIAGVAFLAVRLADTLWSNLTIDMWDQVYDVKVKGLQVLRKTIDLEMLDWVVLCSSLATVFGSPGQANYSGVQTIMEGIAEDIPNCIAITVPPIIDGGKMSACLPSGVSALESYLFSVYVYELLDVISIR